MYKPKYIQNQNIPIALSMKELPEFCIYKYEFDKKNIILYYLVEGRGVSVHFKERDKYNLFPKYFEVESGAWYVERGRWTPTEQFSGSIICKNVSSFKQKSKKGKDFSFTVSKSFFKKKLIIESEKIGIIEFKCNKILPQKYTISIFSLTEKKWVDRKYAIENLNSYFDGSIKKEAFI